MRTSAPTAFMLYFVGAAVPSGPRADIIRPYTVLAKANAFVGNPTELFFPSVGAACGRPVETELSVLCDDEVGGGHLIP